MVAALENLGEGCSVERAGPFMALEVDDVQHAARLVHQGHQLNAAGVEDPEDLLVELLDSGALFAADSASCRDGKGTEVVQ